MKRRTAKKPFRNEKNRIFKFLFRLKGSMDGARISFRDRDRPYSSFFGINNKDFSGEVLSDLSKNGGLPEWVAKFWDAKA